MRAFAVGFVALVAVAGCSTTDPAKERAAAEAALAEVIDQVDLDVDWGTPIIEECFDSLGRGTSKFAARAHSRLGKPGGAGMADEIAERLGTTDIRAIPTYDDIGDEQIGEAFWVLADYGNRNVTVIVSSSDDHAKVDVSCARR